MPPSLPKLMLALVVVTAMLDSALAGNWAIKYPRHKIPVLKNIFINSGVEDSCLCTEEGIAEDGWDKPGQGCRKPK